MKEPFGGIEAGTTAQTVRLQLAPGANMPSKVSCPGGSEGAAVVPVAAAAPSVGGVVTDPIDPKYLTELPWGTRSFWIQPWRAYMDTWPASRLLNSLGVNFNVTATQAPDAARLLQESGFTLARVEIGWNSLSYSSPNEFTNRANIEKLLVSLREHGLRPLILLNSNSGAPAPLKSVTLETTSEAPAGATTVHLSATSAEAVVAGKTGFNGLGFGGSPDVLITSVSAEDVATLSRPLKAALPAGKHGGETLLYAPFGPPELPNGEPNPRFEETLDGWLAYVSAVCKMAEGIFGANGYDLEVWNELSFGSQFLEERNYYSPVREEGMGSVTEVLLRETVDYVRDPQNGIGAGVGISDGFASENAYATGANAPRGITALSKHLYATNLYFPNIEETNGNHPLNALGEMDASGKPNAWTPLFTPEFEAALPEYYLTGLQTETIVRDLAPFTTSIGGAPHGRDAAHEGETPPQVWMTEYNLDASGLLPVNPEDPDVWAGPKINAAQAERVEAEVLLRSLVSMINKGMTREYFFAAANDPGYNLISDQFMSAVNAHPNEYPGSAQGGETMLAFRRLMQRFGGPGPTGQARQLRLMQIAQEGNHAEFKGNGTAGEPNLYDREVLAVLPFQSSPTKFVIPAYVMTPNLTTIYNPKAPEGSPERFTFTAENFRITLGDLPEENVPPRVTAYDPILGEETTARLVSRRGSEATFEMAATNYPRILTLEYT